MRFRLGTLLIVLVLGPAVLAACYSSRGIAVGVVAGLLLVAPLFGLAALAKIWLDKLDLRR